MPSAPWPTQHLPGQCVTTCQEGRNNTLHVKQLLPFYLNYLCQTLGAIPVGTDIKEKNVKIWAGEWKWTIMNYSTSSSTKCYLKVLGHTNKITNMPWPSKKFTVNIKVYEAISWFKSVLPATYDITSIAVEIKEWKHLSSAKKLSDSHALLSSFSITILVRYIQYSCKCLMLSVLWHV